MTPLKILKQAVCVFEELECKYCLVGGHAASLYRTQERLTRDVDFALVADPLSDSRKIAEKAIKSLGLKVMLGFIPTGPHESQRNAICMITSKPEANEAKGIIDILLPELPWVVQAVQRAEHNKINLGFANVPVITPEDLILAKCYALRNSPDRFQDLDDIKEIFQGVSDLDLDYLSENLTKLKLSIPKVLKKYSPLYTQR